MVEPLVQHRSLEDTEVDLRENQDRVVADLLQVVEAHKLPEA